MEGEIAAETFVSAQGITIIYFNRCKKCGSRLGNPTIYGTVTCTNTRCRETEILSILGNKF